MTALDARGEGDRRLSMSRDEGGLATHWERDAFVAGSAWALRAAAHEIHERFYGMEEAEDLLTDLATELEGKTDER